MATQTLRSYCVLDCPDTCALDVQVVDGKVVAIDGADDAATGGYICSKVRRFDRRLNHPDRIATPLRRRGAKGEGGFEPISWTAALDEIAERMRRVREEHGGEAILPYHYGGSNGLLTDGVLDDLLFARLGASRLEKTICAAPSTAVASGMYGKMPGVAFEDFPQARCILIWGANPKASNIHLVPYLREAKRRGAFIAVVDPRRNFADTEVDLHIPVYPGADLAIAMAMIRHWDRAGCLDHAFLEAYATGLETLLEAASHWTFERAAEASRLEDASAIRRLADVYAQSEPALIRAGWGTERNRNGGQALAAILAMPALLGKFGVRGGGYTLSNSGFVSYDASSVIGSVPWRTRSVNMTRLGAALTGDLDPPLRLLFVYNCNPAVTVPDQERVLQGLRRDDLFTVVHEQVMTDTALYADIVLPAPTFLEQHDVRRGYGTYRIAGVGPIVSPAGESRSNNWVFSQLARRLGFEDEAFRKDDQDLAGQVSGAVRTVMNGFDGASLGPGDQVTLDGPVQFETVSPQTPDGKIHFIFRALGDRPYQWERGVLEEFPLALISPGNSKMVSSTLGEFNYPLLRAAMHPQDAAPRGLVDGQQARVFNALGEVRCRIQVTEKVRPGVVSMPKGAWMKSSANARTSTALCPDTLNKVGAGACFNDARVEVERLA